jgi:hypothetical protein
MELTCDSSAGLDNNQHGAEADGAILSITIEGTAYNLPGKMVVSYKISARTQAGSCKRTGPCERNYQEFKELRTALSRKSKLKIPEVRGSRKLENLRT